MNLPMLYVRSGQKEHGLGNQVEGDVTVGNNVVLIEDLVSTGGSSLRAVHALREVGLNVLGMVAIFTYGFPLAERNFQEAGVCLFTLGNYNALMAEAAETGYVDPENLESLKRWRENPSAWKS
jgi:orotate phosphoribosyltransferase